MYKTLLSILIALSLNVEAQTIRVGPPTVVRGPSATEMDSPYLQFTLANGNIRGFTANATSYAIDGTKTTTVLVPGKPRSYSECGEWLSGVYKQPNGILAGFIHVETDCNYPQTRKSMVYAESTDEGLTWTKLGQFISGSDIPQLGKMTGEGDCTITDAQDGYLYAYCLRNSDWRTVVARAPVNALAPVFWKKYYNGGWNQPALGGQAIALGNLGEGSKYLSLLSKVALFNVGLDSVTMSLSSDKVTFNTLSDPIIPLDNVSWERPNSTSLIAYPSIINESTLTYTYIPPNKDFNSRYLVFQNLNITNDSKQPQVGIALSRWSKGNDSWTTIAPTPGFTYDSLLGYMMTKPPTLPSLKLEDCVSDWPGHSDHMLSPEGTCVPAGYQRLQTNGWIYRDPQPNTVPIYRCWNPVIMQHSVSNFSDCEGKGSPEWIMGYALKN